MALDLAGLRPLDTTGLEELDVGGLRPLDTSGLREIEAAPEPERRAVLAEPQSYRIANRERYSQPSPERAAAFREPEQARREDSWAELGRKVIENAPSMFKRSIGGALQGLAEMPPQPPVGIDPWDPQWVPVVETHRQRVESARAHGTLPGQQMFEEATRDLKANAPNVDPDSLKGYAYDIAQSIVQMGPAIATTMATRQPGVGAGMIGGQVAGDRYGESRAAGRSHEEAMADAAFFAAAEAIPETIPLGFLIKPGGRFLSRTLKTGGAESIQEMFTEALQTGYEAGVLNEDMTWGEAIDRIERAGIVGAGAGVGIATITAPFAPREQATDAAGGDMARRQFTPPPRPAGEIEKAAAEPAPVTPEDVESPLPTELIAEGRREMQAAEGASRADQILDQNGLPAVGTRVTVTYPDGRTQTGEIADAFREENAELGITAEGVKVRLDDGSMLEEFFPTLADAGVRIAAAPMAAEESPLAPVLPAESIPARAAPAGEQLAAATPPAAPEPSRAPAPAAGAAEADADGVTYAGQYPDGSSWETNYRLVRRADGSYAVEFTLRDEDGDRVHHLLDDGMWGRGGAPRTTTTLGRGMRAAGPQVESFPTREAALQAIDDDATGRGGRRMAAPAAPSPSTATVDPQAPASTPAAPAVPPVTAEAPVAAAPVLDTTGLAPVTEEVARDQEAGLEVRGEVEERQEPVEADEQVRGEEAAPAGRVLQAPADERAAGGVEAAEPQWFAALTPLGRKQRALQSGLSVAEADRVARMPWRDIPAETRARLEAGEPTVTPETERATLAAVQTGGAVDDIVAAALVRRGLVQARASGYRLTPAGKRRMAELDREAAPVAQPAEPAPQRALKAKAAAKRRAPVDALTFLARRGGVRDDEGHELKRGRNLQRFIPGAGALIRSTGMDIGAAGEALHEAGYFGPPETTPRPTVAQVLDLLDEAARGRRLTPEAQAEAAVEAEGAAAEEANARAREEIAEAGREMGRPISTSETEAILRLMSAEGLDASAAVDAYLERLAIRDLDALSSDTGDPAYEEIPFPGLAEDDRALGEGREGQPREAGDAGERGQNRQDDEGQARGEGAQEGEVAPLPTEETPEGTQTVIPGAERISDRELAERRMAAPARAAVPQRPADEGLFDTGARNQKELFSRGRGYDFDPRANRIAPRSEEMAELGGAERGGAEDDTGDRGRGDRVLSRTQRRAVITGHFLRRGGTAGGEAIALANGPAGHTARVLYSAGRGEEAAGGGEIGRLQSDLAARLEQLGLSDKVALRVVDVIRSRTTGKALPADGRYIERLIEVASHVPDGRWTLNHEAIHALRDLNVIRDPEWKALERAARLSVKPWISPVTGRTVRRLTEIRRRYADQNLTEEELLEEAVADLFADWSAGRQLEGIAGFVRTGLERIKSFLEALANALTRNGFTSADQVFRRIESGEVGAREAIDEPGPMGLSERFMVAWHGSPHDFDEFSTRFINTGERNQAFGWGLYFAGARQVAEHYRKGLSEKQIVRDFRAALPDDADFDEVMDLVGTGHFTAYQERVLKALEADDWLGFDYPAQAISAAYRDLGAYDASQELRDAVKASGRLYKVDLAPAEDEYLLWDKPLSEQSDSVKEAVGRLLAPPGLEDSNPYDQIEAFASVHGGEATGADAYEAISDRLGSDREASLALRAAGIPGIKYLDGGSRNAQQWTILPPDENTTGRWRVSQFGGANARTFDSEAEARAFMEERNAGSFNYVIFDDSLVTITEKYALPKRPARPAGAADTATFSRPETERRWQEARKGAAAQETLVARTRAWLEHIGHGFARHYIALPNTARFADVREQLRKLEAAPQASKEQVVRILKAITDGMTPADLDLFTRKVVLDDLSWEATQERDLPFGMTPEDVQREKAKVDAIIDSRPDLAEAVRQRKLVVRQVANDLVRAGVLRAEQVRNPAYYRHQVLDYARAQVNYAKGAGRKLRSPHWARRMGSTLDINANLLEAEFDWLHKAFTDIATARTIEWIKRSEHNVRADVIAQANAHNRRLVEAALAQEAGPEGFELTAEGSGVGPLNDAWKGFRQRIAMGLARVRQAIDDGELFVPEEFQAAAERLTGDADNDASIFPFLAWILDNNEAGAAGAAMAFKAIGQRKQWVKDLLGDRYADPMDVGSLVKRFAPEGYVAWQPDEGKLLFTAKTIPEHALDRMLDRLAEAGAGPVTVEEMRAAIGNVRSMLMVGGNKFEMVIPEELAATLNSLRDEHADSLIEALFEVPMRLWKRWVLINPRRVIKYNLNNLSGDIDAVIAGNPKALRRMGTAIKELYAVMIRGEAPSARYREAVERGVFDSGLSIQEIPDINILSEFEHLIEKPSALRRPDRFALSGLMKVWRALQRYTQFRENWLRYAAYLDYVERLEAGEGMDEIGYGAAVPEMVDAIRDPKDKAALLARELVGDYGAVSHWGQGIRKRYVPFWSWLEINSKRYWRLTSNAYGQGIGQGLRTTGIVGAALGARTTAYLALRMALMYGLIHLWNNLVFGDDEDDLDPEERARLHLLLGRSDDGQIRMLRIQGAFGDALSWFGFEDVVDAVSEIEKGRAGFGEVLAAIAKAPVNKIASGLTPVLKTPLELATGQTFWPDVFRPMPIRDEWRHLMRTFSLEHEYDLVFDKPSRGYGQSLSDAVVYSRDAGEIAYNRMKSMAYDWLRREKGREGAAAASTPRAEALYEWRLAKRYGDAQAERAARERLRELGVTGDDLEASIKRAHPLGPVAIKDRRAFLDTLTADERKQLDQAIEWYRETFLD